MEYKYKIYFGRHHHIRSTTSAPLKVLLGALTLNVIQKFIFLLGEMYRRNRAYTMILKVNLIVVI